MNTTFTLLTIYLVGFRHGFDLDHIAAITDITVASRDRKQALVSATLYALGHALVVFLLGFGVVLLGGRLPAGVDELMGRVIGVTLIGLGVYVLGGLARRGAAFRPTSRGLLLIVALRRAVDVLLGRRESELLIEHEHEHSHALTSEPDHHLEPHPADDLIRVAAADKVATVTKHRHAHTHRGLPPPDPFAGYGRAAAFGVGMIHGVGAETPTQLLVLLTAAGVAHIAYGSLVIATFVLGLVSANTVLAVAWAFGKSKHGRVPRVYTAIAALSGAFSLGLGVSYLL
ncbi:MAG: hypothetical protein ABR505_06010 [Actinomycetota bacterium]